MEQIVEEYGRSVIENDYKKTVALIYPKLIDFIPKKTMYIIVSSQNACRRCNTGTRLFNRPIDTFGVMQIKWLIKKFNKRDLKEI